MADLLLKDALAVDNDERVAKALSKHPLYERIFSRGPRIHDSDETESEVADYIAIYVWSMTVLVGPGPRAASPR